MGGAQLFIGYSHADERWKDRLLEHLAPLVKQGLIEPWDVGDIPAGANFDEHIAKAISGAKVAIFLVSASFLASDFISKYEPLILEKHRAGGLVLVPVLVRACEVKDPAWLSTKQRLPRCGRALAQLERPDQDVALTEVARELKSLLTPPSEPPPRRRESEPPIRRESEPPRRRESEPPGLQEAEPPGMHYNPAWYVPHVQKEEIVLTSLRYQGTPIIVTAPPASGKSTVLWHLVRRLRAENHGNNGAVTVIPVDLGRLTDPALNEPEACFHELASLLTEAYANARHLHGKETSLTEGWVESVWQQPGTPERRLKRLLEKQLLENNAFETILVLDRFDRLIGKPAGNPVARMLRAWMENRDHCGPWASLRLLLAVRGSSLHFPTPDELSELFAAALYVRIESFDLDQLHRLAGMYGGKWAEDELRQVLALVDGQPFFSRQIFFLEAKGTPKGKLLDIEQLKLEYCAAALHQIWLVVSGRDDLRKPLCALLRDPSTRLSADENARLYQAGLIRKTDAGSRVSNNLLASYIKERC